MDLTEFLSSVRGWTNFLDVEVFSDELLTSFLRLGEQDLSLDMRCKEMLQIDTATIINERVTLPDDFQSMDFIRIVGGRELKYKPRGEFYVLVDEENSAGYYTTSGAFIMVGGAPSSINAKQVELHYFGDVPALEGAANWVSTRYISALTAATMKWASIKMDDQSLVDRWTGEYTSVVSRINDAYTKSIGSGSRLSRYVKGFG